MSVINTATNTVTTTITGLIQPFDIAVTSNGAYAYVANGGSNSVSVISTATNKVTTKITVRSGPYGVAITPNDEYAYIVNFNSASVSVINVFPAVSVSPSPLTMKVGQSEMFTATPSGGSGTYKSYQWYVNGSTQSCATASTFNFVLDSSVSYSITATVTDSLGAISAPSTPATVTMSSATVTPTSTNIPIDVNTNSSDIPLETVIQIQT